MAEPRLFLISRPRGGVVVQLTRRRGRLCLSEADAAQLEALLQARRAPKCPAGTTVGLAEVAVPLGELAPTAWTVAPTPEGVCLSLHSEQQPDASVARVFTRAAARDLAESLLRLTGPGWSESQLPGPASPAPAGAGMPPPSVEALTR